MRFIRKPVAVAAGVALATVAAGASFMPTAAAETSDVSIDWRITQDWGTGFQGTVTVTNSSNQALNPWSVNIPYGNSISSAWDATVTSVNGGYRITGPAWSTALAPSSSATFGFIGQSRGSGLIPTTCTIPSGTCSVISTTSSGAVASANVPASSPIASPIPAPASGDGSAMTPAAVTVAVKVTSEWNTGRNVDLTITNTGSNPINGWTISIPWTGSSVSMWNATGNVSGGSLTARNAPWNGVLAPGATATIGMTDYGRFTAPQSCSSSEGSCTIAGSGQTSNTSSSTPGATAASADSYTPQSDGYAGAKKIIAYYPSWATYARNYQVADIPAHKVTHINYAFANVRNGSCVLGDSYGDTDKAFAGDSWDQGAKRGNFNQLSKLRANNPKLKTMISIGGWTWSQNFSAAAASDQSRKQFASSCIAFMKQYEFDGVDID